MACGCKGGNKPQQSGVKDIPATPQKRVARNAPASGNQNRGVRRIPVIRTK